WRLRYTLLTSWTGMGLKCYWSRLLVYFPGCSASGLTMPIEGEQYALCQERSWH
ncbi:hypothetical protein AVDCRST_MAG81-1268, partial [uncultured Synechococcales cyanobacterium]